jgi:tetratricopeptide (TPR) repeat protein
MISAAQTPIRLRVALCAALLATTALAQPAPRPDLVATAGEVHELLASDSWREALELAETAYQAHPDDPRAAALLGPALFRAGRFEELDALLTPLLGANGDAAAGAHDAAPEVPPWALLTLARLRNAQGRWGESADLVRRAVAAAPDDRLLLYRAADVAPSRALTVAWLERYLELSEGDDPDRIEDAEGTLRVLRELGDRKVWIALERPDKVELPLRHVWDEGGATVGYVLTAAAGERGKPAKLLFDTGNHGLYVIHRVARKRDFGKLGEATTYGGGGSGRHEVLRGVFPVFDVGGLRYGDALVTSSKEELDPTGRFQGLIGLSAFAGYRITIDFKRKRLILELADEPLEGEPYWTVSGQVLVRAGAEGAEPGLFLLDTGAMRSLVSLDYASGVAGATLRESAELRGLGGAYEGARSVDGIRLSFQALEGEGRLTAVDTTTRSRMTGVEISGYLGLEVLGRGRVVIDTRHQRIRVER